MSSPQVSPFEAPRERTVEVIRAIQEFQGQYRFLSSMYPLEVPLNTDCGPVPSVEHAYQMERFVHPSARAQVAAARSDVPGKEDGIIAKQVAKRLWNTVPGPARNPEWEEQKLAIMAAKQREKFVKNPGLAARLLATDDLYIEEGNRWDDTFWGVSPPRSGHGLNHLGIILMEIREELREVPAEA